MDHQSLDPVLLSYRPKLLTENPCDISQGFTPLPQPHTKERKAGPKHELGPGGVLGREVVPGLQEAVVATSAI